MKEYNLNAMVFIGFDGETIYGKVNDFKNEKEFKNYLIGEGFIDCDANFINEYVLDVIYMRYYPKGNEDTYGESAYCECKKGRGATLYYVFRG